MVATEFQQDASNFSLRRPLLAFSPPLGGGRPPVQRYSYSSYWWRLQNSSTHFSPHEEPLGSSNHSEKVSIEMSLCPGTGPQSSVAGYPEDHKGTETLMCWAKVD